MTHSLACVYEISEVYWVLCVRVSVSMVSARRVCGGGAGGRVSGAGQARGEVLGAWTHATAELAREGWNWWKARLRDLGCWGRLRAVCRMCVCVSVGLFMNVTAEAPFK